MRTTLTLDNDVALTLKEEMRRTGSSFKEMVNTILHANLKARRHQASPKPFIVQPRDLKARPGVDLDHIEALLDEIEGPYRR